MTLKLVGSWQTHLVDAVGYSYNCGFCGSTVGPSKQYHCKEPSGVTKGNIYLCPNCNKPTFINKMSEEQVPGVVYGAQVEHLPEDIEQLYNEARKCLSVNAFTSSVLSCRKLLMNISVSKGAKEGESFAYYVKFLEENHFVPPGSKPWVDHIRKKGNEATHEIPSINKDDAVELLEFIVMLLRFVYELPGRMIRHTN